MVGNIHVSENKKSLATDFSQWLKDFINQHHHKNIHIALSGGSTPLEVYDTLVHPGNAFLDDIKWEKVFFYWGDERCVPPDDEESNFGQAKTHLFDHAPINESHIFRILGEQDPEREVQRYSELLKENLPFNTNLPQFDLIILGVGDDGHTASIFPNQMELLAANKTCEVARHPVSGQQRISLTGNVLNNAANVAFLVAGENKKSIIKEISNDSEKSKIYPTAHITKAKSIDWFLDNAAAEYII